MRKNITKAPKQSGISTYMRSLAEWCAEARAAIPSQGLSTSKPQGLSAYATVPQAKCA